MAGDDREKRRQTGEDQDCLFLIACVKAAVSRLMIGAFSNITHRGLNFRRTCGLTVVQTLSVLLEQRCKIWCTRNCCFTLAQNFNSTGASKADVLSVETQGDMLYCTWGPIQMQALCIWTHVPTVCPFSELISHQYCSYRINEVFLSRTAGPCTMAPLLLNAKSS